MKRRRFLRDHGLTLVLLLLTIASLAGHLLAGHRVALLEDPGSPGAQSLAHYAVSGHFLVSLFENWESEFLQMATYVLITIALFQRGASDSKNPDGGNESVDEDPELHRDDSEAPWPVRRGGFALKLYSTSLGGALALCFALSLAGHVAARAALVAQTTGTRPGVHDVLTDPQFLFESFQNWQSEFLSILLLVVMSIFLRQRGSPESKPVHFPHSRTGRD